MTRILVRTLADARDGVRVLDATITATASRARVDGDTITLPEPVAVRLRRGELSAPLELEAPDGTWAWRFLVQPTSARLMDALSFLRTFPDVVEVEWGDMTPVDPETLAPLDPLPPSAAQVLLRAEEAITVGEQAIEDATGALSVANTAVVSGTVVADDLILTRKNGGTINAGNVRGLPGSIVPWGTDLGGFDLNTITAQGVYRQPINSAATLERNYPLALNGGILEVFHAINAANLVQRFTPYNGLTFTRGVFIRRIVNGVAGTWMFTGGSRTDKTAGIAIYSWDEVAQREQLTYGDTGLRTVNAELGVTAGNVYIRRRGYEVTISFVNAVFGTLSGQQDLPALPTGWRPQVNSNAAVFINLTANRCIAISNGVLRLYGLAAGGQVDGTFTFSTVNSWPTTLIGNANGTIPQT